LPIGLSAEGYLWCPLFRARKATAIRSPVVDKLPRSTAPRLPPISQPKQIAELAPMNWRGDMGLRLDDEYQVR
jgi:hypothetical protein